jgi:hypothetical protein
MLGRDTSLIVFWMNVIHTSLNEGWINMAFGIQRHEEIFSGRQGL